ncbi:cupin domain-containing protein [Mesorhizobium sp. B3-1-3]|uniref:helix-turn-helix domain-containing protein n=1 Tax=unclassified Mesorhizobium TaxID=325217 RepID=UPI00112A89B6|nr:MULTISPECIES: cupin domain-containing protein [unclassified Mesorhizobium]TPI56050.1 cupin domain-containing protein [Mesorhizobium sp. B3-1-8]TPI63344.1 cupin domain-containing protein [Mesorhizobium sp. B3-1-3]
MKNRLPNGTHAAAQPNQESEAPPVLGQQIRQIRKMRGVTLQQLSEAVGLSMGYLSQIERGRSKLTVEALSAICNVLETPANWFFHAGEPQRPEDRYILRKSSRKSISYHGAGVKDELLSPHLAGPLELLLVTIAPGGDTGEYRHAAGFESGVVIAGNASLYIGDQWYELDTGDSFSFESTKTHRIKNIGDTEAKIVWVITPASL